MAFTLKGETGKALDATARSFADLKIRDVSFRVESAGIDTLTWTCETADIAAGDTILPDYGQIVELYNGADRKFLGYVTDVRNQLWGARVTVSGPWWFLTKVALSGDKTDQTGATAERVSYVFPDTSTTAQHIQALLTRAQTVLGCPITFGTLAATFKIPRATFSNMSCADALAELLRWTPDAVTRVNYASGVPSIDVVRRGSAAVTTYNLGADNILNLDVNPRIELQVTAVDVKFSERSILTGKASFKSQAAGTPTLAKRQVITISGEEMDTFLPKDDFDSFTIQTVPASSPGSAAFKSFVLSRIPAVISARQQYVTAPKDSEIILGDGTAMGPYYTDSGFTPGANQVPTVIVRPPTFLDANGNVVNPSGKYLLTTDAPPDWATQVNVQKVKITGEIAVEWLFYQYRAPYSASNYQGPFAPPYWYPSMGFAEIPYYKLGSGLYDHWYVELGRLPYEIEAYLTTTAYPSATTLYKPLDYTFITPPANLATNLLAAQNWLPWEGTITLEGEAYCTGDNLLDRKFRVTGGAAGMATMDALPKAITYDLSNLQVSIELGAPARSDYRSLVARIRQSAQDNIIVTV